MSDQYFGQERHRAPRNFSELEEIVDRKFKEHEERETAMVEERLAALKEEAFPDGPLAHKQAHQAMIDAANAQKEFWQMLKNEIITKSIWGILRILAILLAAGVIAKFGLGPAWFSWLSK